MSRSQSQQKNLLKFNKAALIDQPLTEIQKVRVIEKKPVGLVSFDAEKKKNIEVTPVLDKLECVNPSTTQNTNTGAFKKKIEETKSNFRFELRCIDEPCDKDDVLSLISYGGYSVKSKMGKMNEVVHNHRKVIKQTVYNFQQDQIPLLKEQIYKDFELIPEQQTNLNQGLSKVQKQKLRLSSFAYLFGNKRENKNQQQRQIIHDENRQKQEIEKFNKNHQKEMEAQRNMNSKNQSIYMTKNPLKLLTKHEDLRKEKNGSNVKSGDSIEQNMKFLNEKERIKTRQKQKQEDLSDFQVSRQPQPLNAYRYCYPCKSKFENYKIHIDSVEHKFNIKKAVGNSFFLNEVQSHQRFKKQEINSIEYKNLEILAAYLENLADSTEGFIFKKHKELKMSLKEIYDELERQFNM